MEQTASLTETPNLLAIYSTLPSRLENVLAGLGEDELEVLPFCDSFSIKEIVFYMVDAEMNDAVNFRELLTRSNFSIKESRQDLFGKILRYQDKQIYELNASLTLFSFLRNINTRLLRNATASWAIEIIHSVYGSLSFAQFLEMIIKRDEKCIRQIISRKRLFEKGPGSQDEHNNNLLQ